MKATLSMVFKYDIFRVFENYFAIIIFLGYYGSADIVASVVYVYI